MGEDLRGNPLGMTVSLSKFCQLPFVPFVINHIYSRALTGTEGVGPRSDGLQSRPRSEVSAKKTKSGRFFLVQR